LHISYRDSTIDDLKYATCSSSVYICIVLDKQHD
jgi:hypothetical protein